MKARMVDAVGNLRCSRCQQSKSVGEFGRCKPSASGYAYWCKSCQKLSARRSRETNMAAAQTAQRKYRNTNREAIRARDRDYYQRNKEKFASRYNTDIASASSAVRTEVLRGRLPKVTTTYCVRCLQPAQNYHHQSYLKADRLCVVPVCISCHQRMNRQRPDGNSDLGVVPTHFGIVRIAIASVP